MNPHGDEVIQDPVPLWMSKSTFALEPDSLNGGPPQEVLVVKVVHRIVEIGVTLPVQTIHDAGILGVGVNDVGATMRVSPLVGTRNVELGDTIGVLGDVRHDNEKMRRW